jgi:PAS domain S-box-containing protein
MADLRVSGEKEIIRVLHVDDDPSILEVSKLILMSIDNFDIECACCVDDAFKKLCIGNYDVIISDYEMPQKTGLEFLKELREKKVTTPFFIFTGKGREEVVITALNLGADGYINKHGDTETVYGELAHNIRAYVEKAHTKEALQDSEAKFSAFIKQVGEGVFIVQDQILEFANDALAKMLGYSLDEIEKKCFIDFISPESQKIITQAINTQPPGQVDPSFYEVKLQRKNGTIIDVELSAIRIQYGGKTADFGIMRDITERKLYEESLRLSENRYRSLFDNSFDGVMMTKPDGSILSANPQACRMLGMTEYEIKKAGIEGIIQNDEKLAVALKEQQDKGSMRADLIFLRRDGTKFVGEVSSVIFSDAEGITKTSMIIRDVTERKKAEEALNQTRDQLVMNIEKLSVIGSLTRHDVRNKLVELNGYAYLLKRKYGGQRDVMEGLAKIEQKIKDAECIFDFAKLYEQLGAKELAYVDVEKTADYAVGLFSDLNFKVINSCQGLNVLADSILRQLFYNFIDNTKKYGKKITEIRIHYEIEKSGDLRLYYEDNGVGISAENKPKLFKKGFSTGGSTGFGLFLVKKIIDSYGWTILEEGEPGEGVKFTILIPKVNKDGKESFNVPDMAGC